MTYKCDFCGKTHSDPAKYTECVQKCSESIGKKAQQISDLEKQIKHHFDEYCRLSEELYVLAPNASSLGRIIEISWPDLDFFNPRGL